MKVLLLIPTGQQPRGRPRKRTWIDCIQDHMEIMGVEPADALKRVTWRNGCRVANTTCISLLSSGIDWEDECKK